MKKAVTGLMLITVLNVSACSFSTHIGPASSGVPNGSQVAIEYGYLLAVQQIKAPRRTNTADTVGSAVVGGALGAGLGSLVAHKKAKKGAAIIGGALGAAAGGAGAQNAQHDGVISYTVTKDNGLNVIITQNIALGEPVLQPGQRVIIQTAGNSLRVFAAPPTVR